MHGLCNGEKKTVILVCFLGTQDSGRRKCPPPHLWPDGGGHGACGRADACLVGAVGQRWGQRRRPGQVERSGVEGSQGRKPRKEQERQAGVANDNRGRPLRHLTPEASSHSHRNDSV